MQLEQQISAAVCFHHDLKRRMAEAVASGESPLTVARLCRDDQCKLGQWLYELDDTIKATPRWKCVQVLHADFHQEAAKVLGFALAGDGRSARAAISYSSAYAGIARRFEAELGGWKREAAAGGAGQNTRAWANAASPSLRKHHPLSAYSVGA